MKKFIFLLFCWFTSFSLNAQVVLNIQGDVSDLLGEAVADVQINIYSGEILMETVFTDNSGYYSNVIEDASNEGLLIIEMIDCDSSSEFGYWEWSPETLDIVQDFTFCEQTNNFCFAQIWGDSLNFECDTLIQLYAAAEGVPPLIYQWSTGSQESEIYVGESGCYGLTVTDALGCVKVDTKCVEFLGNCCAATIIENEVNSLEAIASGLAPFTYEWSTGGIGSFIDVVETGNYCVTITDATGCVANNCYYYTGVGNFCSVTIFQGGPNSLQAAGSGIESLTYEWSNGATESIIDVDETGNYCVTITDVTGCVATDCFYYNAGGVDSCSVVLLNPDSSFCLFAVATGVAPFTYQWEWTDINSPDYCADFYGTHCVTVTDATGCVASACYDFPITWCAVDLCEVLIEDEIEIHALPIGNAPFTYEWNTGETEEIITPTEPGNYCVTMTDATGCESNSCLYYSGGGIDTCSVEMVWNEEVGCLLVYSEGTAPFTYEWNIEGCGNSSFNCPHVSGLYCVTVIDAAGCVAVACYEVDLECDIQISIPWAEPGTLSAFPTGTEPFTFEWNTGETTTEINPIDDGTYCVTLTDGTGCVTTDCYDYSTSPVDTLCFTLLSEIEGGACLQANTIGVAPFTYQWSEGSTGDILCDVEDGVFCVTVTDAEGCVSQNCGWIENSNTCFTYIDSLTITQTGEFSLVAITNGTAPFTYEWNNGSTDQAISPTEAGDYCVIVFDALGCVSTSCYYFSGIEVVDSCYTVLNSLEGGICLQAETYGNAPFTYQWSDGSTNGILCSTDTSGLFCVTVTDATGCVSDACGFIFPFNNCFTYIDSTSTSGNETQLSANTDGVAPFTYEWNTGSTEYAVIAVEEGTYCVTVTDAQDCISTSCYYYTIPCDPSFSIEIQIDADSCLTAVATGTGPFTYNWIFNGITGPTICPNVNTHYCVQVTNGNDCVLTECFKVEFLPEFGFVAGRIFTDSLELPELSGTVYLIVYDSITGTLAAVDTTSIFSQGGNNSYFFEGVPAGNYLVKVALDESSDDYEDYLPTYYGDVLFWDEAYFVGVPYDFFTADIHMVAGDNDGGPGFIGGLVIEGANFTGFADTRDAEGDPIANVLIILLDESGNPVTYTYTNEDGEYGFDNLPWGTYQIVVEILGFEQSIFEITIGPNNPEVTDIIFEVDEDSVSSISTNIEDIIDVNKFSLFPNPTNGELTIEMEMKANIEVFISLMSVDGRKVLEIVKTVDYGMNRVPLDLSQFTNGVYFLNIVNGSDIISRKVILQK